MQRDPRAWLWDVREAVEALLQELGPVHWDGLRVKPAMTVQLQGIGAYDGLV